MRVYCFYDSPHIMSYSILLKFNVTAIAFGTGSVHMEWVSNGFLIVNFVIFFRMMATTADY